MSEDLMVPHLHLLVDENEEVAGDGANSSWLLEFPSGQCNVFDLAPPENERICAWYKYHIYKRAVAKPPSLTATKDHLEGWSRRILIYTSASSLLTGTWTTWGLVRTQILVHLARTEPKIAWILPGDMNTIGPKPHAKLGDLGVWMENETEQLFFLGW